VKIPKLINVERENKDSMSLSGREYLVIMIRLGFEFLNAISV